MSKDKPDVSKFLEQWVVHDGKPITARLLSVLKKCHISAAHESMADLYDGMSKRDADSLPFTTWIIKGPLKPEMTANADSQTSIDSMDVDEDDTRKTPLTKEALLLVSQDKLKETEEKFASISVKQVYSFSPRLSAKHTEAHKIAAISQLTTIQHDLHSNKEYIDAWESTGRGAELGTIQSVEKWGDKGKPNLPQNGAGPSRLSAPVIKKEAVKEVKKEEKKDSSKESKKAEGLNFAKAKGASKSKRKLVESDDEEESTAKGMPIDDEDDEDDAGPIGYSTEKTKAEVVEESKSGKAVRKRADAGDKMTTDEEKRRQKQELIDMMDEDEAGDADPPAIETGQKASTSMMQGTADTAEDSKSEGNQKAESETPAAKRRVRKQRKIIKKVKTKDSKGYTKTQDVEEYESYSSDGSDTPAIASKAAAKVAPKAAAAAAAQKEAPPMAKTNSGNNTATKKGASGGTGVGGQRKLASFFTKK